MLRKSLALPLVAVALGAGLAPAAHAQLALPRLSPKASVMQQIGITDLTLTYSRPGVKGREIWGQLVPYDKPWRAGANEATTLTLSHYVAIDGKPLPAGSYAIVTLPTASDWTVIFSKQKELWAVNQYDPKDDALRVTVKPTQDDAVEWLQYTFEDLTPNSANLVLRWEKTKLAVPITVDVNGIALAHARDEVGKAKADDWRTPFRAAQYTFENNVALDEGAKWLDQSIAIQPSWSNMNLKARWLAKNGDTKGAVEAANKALAINKAAKTPADASQLETLVAEWSGKK